MPSKRPGELDAWVAATAQRALAYAVTLVGNRADAEDIVHDCYGRLLAQSHNYDLPRDGMRLLFAAVTNACRNRARRKPRMVSLDAAEYAVGPDRLVLAAKPGTGPVDRATHRELEQAVAAALAELPVTHRAVVELRSMGHSLSEVAAMLDMSHSNARVMLHRARRVLAVKLRPFLEERVR